MSDETTVTPPRRRGPSKKTVNAMQAQYDAGVAAGRNMREPPQSTGLLRWMLVAFVAGLVVGWWLL